MTRKAINSTLAATIGPYSHAVESNGLLFLSGQTPVDLASGALVDGDIGRQTEQCLRNLFNVLSAAQLSEADVISVSVYLTDMNDFAQMNAVYARHFAAPFPARTTIGCASLPMAAKVEIGLIARLPPGAGRLLPEDR